MAGGESSLKVKDWNGHSGRVLDTVGGIEVIECDGCGFKHIAPIPSDEELRSYYSEGFVQERPLYIEKLEEDLEWWNTVYDDRYGFLEGRLPEGRRRVLDIGCGLGHFLNRGRKRGWQTLGIEPSRQSSRHAQSLGLDVENTTFDEFELKGGPLDAIHFSEVLEHIADPLWFLDKTKGLLADDGVICTVVPNDYSPVQKVLRERLGFKPYWVSPSQHINYFSFDSLAALLDRSGFKVIERTAMFPMDFFLLMGDDYVSDGQLGRQCHAKRKSLDIMLSEPGLADFKKEMYQLMARHSIGREMVVYAEKK